MTVSNQPTYASELFGPGHDSPVYPDGMTPRVTLFIPENHDAVADDPGTADEDETMAARDHRGSVEITFTFIGAEFDAAISGLMFDNDATEASTNADVAAPANVATIVSGGGKGDSHLTITLEEADQSSNSNDGRNNTSVAPPGTAGAGQSIYFDVPRLANLALSGANAMAPEKSVKLRVTWRLVSGAFTAGPFLTGGAANGFTEKVVLARDSLTLGISGNHAQAIVIDGDSAFTSIKTPPAAKGYVTLATVTVTTQQLNPATAVAGKAREVVGKLQTGGADTDGDNEIYNDAVTAVPASPWELHDLDGKTIDEGLRGTLTIHASGTRGLFNEDDMLFIDYDNDGKMGQGEMIAIDGDMAEGEALSIDPDKSQSFKDGITGNFKVQYMPGGKGHINHDSKIKVTAVVDYSDPSAVDEAPKSNYTTLNFDGVGDPIMAYAIPHSTNGNGDTGNVRVRCEQAPAGSDEMCRVFLECWDDMGNRGFGEAPMIGQDMVMVWGGDDVEGVAEGLGEPESRISCRVLSKGDVTVQQLTRDGHSRTLVNNTFVAD
ncbi:MAG: hypothetical protein OXS50_07955 [Gammaproteobacteria bacterium]|nr:hypothetical protein [Gammaproteobacteria bacterium]